MALTIEKAQQILDDYYDLVHPQYEDDIQFINALEFLISGKNINSKDKNSILIHSDLAKRII